MEDGGNFLEHMSFFRRERNACIFGFLEAFPEGRNFRTNHQAAVK